MVFSFNDSCSLIIREMITLLLTPLLAKWFGTLA